MSKTKILIAGPSADLCETIRAALAAQPQLEIEVRAVELGTVDFHAPPDGPVVLVAALGLRWEESLRALSQPGQRPPTLAVGPSNDPQILRRAMQTGVRDYIGAPFPAEDLIDAVLRIAREQAPVAVLPDGQNGRLFAVINVKGGSGASFIAANVAHIAAKQRKCDVALLDLDLQFGALPLVFDLEQRSTLLEALSSASQLDGPAMRGFMVRHSSGVHVLSAMSEQLILPWEVSREALTRLLQVARQSFPIVVADLPRQIDPLTTAVLEQADRVLVVMQQSLTHARDAKRMQHILINTLGIAREKVLLIVNRHSDKQSVSEDDIHEAVSPASMMSLPNDFTTVSAALNVGVPVYEYNRDAPITRALVDLLDRLGLGAGPANPRKRGLREVFAHAMRN